MKKGIVSILLAMLVAVCPTASQAQNGLENMKEKKILIAFFSRAGENYAVGNIEKGNTHIIAEMIAEETGGTLFRIEPATPYPEDYAECTEVAKKERDNRSRPAVKNDIAAENYDVIFVGYPNWWGDMPMPVYTFIEKHDWRDKTVIPFCTHEGSRLSDTEHKLKEVCKGASVPEGLAVRGATAQKSREQARRNTKIWLNNLNY